MAQTQWRVASFAFIGLDYAAVFSIAEVKGIEITPAITEKLRALEHFELKKQQEGRPEDG